MRRWRTYGRKGRSFAVRVQEQIYGRIIMLMVPGADDMQLYQPTHKVAYNLGDEEK